MNLGENKIIESLFWTKYNFKGYWMGEYPIIESCDEPSNYVVYIVLDSWNKETTTLNYKDFQWSFEYIIKYIGKGIWNMGSYGVSQKRPFNHRNDLYSDNLKMYSNRYLLTFLSYNLSELAAYELESIFINLLLDKGYRLSPKNLRKTETLNYQIWNKIKGHKINGNYFRQTS